MGDPILAMHRHTDRRYELTSLRTGSLRDQMLRATSLVDRLVTQGLVGPAPGQPLLVVGAGAAGVCAAMAASRQGVAVWLVEARHQALLTQKGVTSRYINPTEFDWPHPHWRDGCFPATPTLPFSKPLPLGFAKNDAAQLALHWRAEFQDWCQHHAGRGSHGALHFLPNTRLLPAALAAHADGEDWVPPGSATPLRFGAVLACTGFGPEDVWAPGGFHGDLFWGDDRLDSLPDRAVIVVSGGGDGAMQDFQRAVTRQFGTPLFDALGLGTLPIDWTPLFHAEDVCRRVHAWRAPDGHTDAALLDWWQAAFDRVVDDILQQWRADPKAQQQAMAVVQRPNVCWVMKHAAPGHCYALNRLLSTLLVRLMALQRPSVQAWRPADPLKHVAPNGGGGKPWQVTLESGTRLLADQVIVRHGLPATMPEDGSRPARHFFGEAPISDQLVPYAYL